MAPSSPRRSPGAASRASTSAKRCACKAYSTSSRTTIGRAWPPNRRPTRTTSGRNKVRRFARSTMSGSGSAGNRSRSSSPKNGKSRASPPRWCASNIRRKNLTPICRRNATMPSRSRSPKSHAATPAKPSPPPPCVTRRSISFRARTIIRWNCSPRPRSGRATASSRSTTRPRACRTCSAICAAYSRSSQTGCASCRRSWAAASARGCARNIRRCWRCWRRSRCNARFVWC